VTLEAVAIEEGGEAVMVGAELVAGRALVELRDIKQGADETADPVVPVTLGPRLSPDPAAFSVVLLDHSLEYDLILIQAVVSMRVVFVLRSTETCSGS